MKGQLKPYQIIVIDEKLLQYDLDCLSEMLSSFSSHNTPMFVVFSDKPDNQRIVMLKNEVSVTVIAKPIMPSKIAVQVAKGWREMKNKNTKAKASVETSIFPSVLLVEDNQNNILAEKMILEALGCEVDVAMNGDEAMECVRNPANQYSLVVLDIGLPGKMGYEVAPMLKELAPAELPIVALTAYVSDSDKAKCHLAGIQEIIAKPATIELLEATVRKYVEIN